MTRLATVAGTHPAELLTPLAAAAVLLAWTTLRATTATRLVAYRDV